MAKAATVVQSKLDQVRAKYPGMGDLALRVHAIYDIRVEIEKNGFASDKSPSFAQIDEFMKQQQALMDASDAAAKAAGKLVGRVVAFGVADGSALYEVAFQNGTKAYLRHIYFCDGYQYRFAGNKGFADPLVKNGVLIEVPVKWLKSYFGVDALLKGGR